MRATPRLLAYLRSRRPAPPAPAPAPKTPLPDNPYHRCFTADRSFEELVRAARAPAPDAHS